MRFRRSSRWANRPDINLNAFLDLVLNILLFFVFATELAVTEAIDIQIPKSEQAKATTEEKSQLVVFITKENEFVFENEKVPLDQLAQRLKARQNQDVEDVIIRGDSESSLQATVSAFGACQEAGIFKIRIEARKPPPGSAGQPK